MRWSSLILCALIWSLINPRAGVANDPLVPLPTQPSEMPWPTQSWPQAEKTDLDKSLDPVFTTNIDEGLGETRGILIIKGGELIYERYRPGFTADTRHVSWSVAKSITTTLVGRAVQTGLIASIDDPMPAAFQDGDPRADISWRHWLQLLDGLDYHELGEADLTDNDAVQMMYGDGKYDQLAYVRSEAPLVHTPGTRWNYSTATFHLVARSLQSLLPNTCMTPGEDTRLCQANPEIMMNWVNAVLFDPLGIDGVVEFDAAGTMLGGSNIYMRAQDYARFGLLILRDGIWNGERLLPEGWVDFNRTNPSDSDLNVYGAGFWPSPEVSDDPETQHYPPFDAFHAGGREGQLVWIIPSLDMVIIRVGLMRDGRENWNNLFKFTQDLAVSVD